MRDDKGPYIDVGMGKVVGANSTIEAKAMGFLYLLQKTWLWDDDMFGFKVVIMSSHGSLTHRINVWIGAWKPFLFCHMDSL